MLTPEDQHRDQAAQNLTQTLICAEAFLKEIGIYDDFKTIVAAIKNHQDPNANNPSLIQNETIRNFTLEITNPEQLAQLFQIRNQQLDGWISLINDLEPHMQYSDKLEKFKNKFKVKSIYKKFLQLWIEMHTVIMRRQLMTAPEVVAKEKQYMQVDIT